MSNAGDQRTPTATRLGSYEIVCKLAEGGMAELFLARTVGPLGFEKLVVLKKILPHFAANPKFVQLFLEEAKLAAGLDHPHIAHVYDMGMIDGNYFFTMEYIHGQDLRAMLRRTGRRGQKFPIEHAVQITRDIAAALHYAHERRRADGALLDIVHRDVSPSNVLVSYDGAVKLLDFGVAKAASSSVKTRTGTLKGKIGYMSPEQARGSPIDRRSDLFSLGVMAWEMIATRRLFKADNDLATIQQIIHSPAPPASKVRPDCPPELERIVARALSADTDARYQTAQQMQVDLEEFAREHKLAQSSIALSKFLVDLFDDEHAAWVRAQTSGSTLLEFVASGSVADATTPVSASGGDLAAGSFEDDEDDDAVPTASPAVRSAPIAAPTVEVQLDASTEIGPPPVMPSDSEAAPTMQMRAPTPPPMPELARGLAPVEARTPPQVAPVPPPVAPPVVASPPPPQVAATFPAHAFGPEPTYQVKPRRSWVRPAAIAAGVLGVGIVILLLARGGSGGDDTRTLPAAGSQDRPVAKPDDPAAKPDEPVAKPDEPVAKPDEPVAKPDRPKPNAVKPDGAAATPDKPDKPRVVRPAKPTRPTTKPDRPTTKPDRPPVKPPAKPPKPFDPDEPLPPPS